MKFVKFSFISVIAAAALWSCEKAEPELSLVQPQEEFAVEQESPVNIIDEMNYATETINSILFEQLADVSAVAEDIVAAPDNVFPSVEVKEGVVNLLRSIMPQDATITGALPFVYSNIDNTFGIMSTLVAQLRMSVDERTGLYGIGPSASASCLAHFETSSGDIISIGFSDTKGSRYEGFQKSRNQGYGLYVEKNDTTVFKINSEDEVDDVPSIFLGSGLECRHIHSGSLSISAIEMLLDYDVDFAAERMKYKFAMSMPMFADADTLLKVTGDFQQKGFGLTRRIESDQWFSMMDGGININVKSSDLKTMVGLMASALLKDESGYPEEFCKNLYEKWTDTAHVLVYYGKEESGYVYLGYLPVDEEDPDPELYVPEILVHLYDYDFGSMGPTIEFTIPEFIEEIEPMLPEISLPF